MVTRQGMVPRRILGRQHRHLRTMLSRVWARNRCSSGHGFQAFESTENALTRDPRDVQPWKHKEPHQRGGRLVEQARQVIPAGPMGTQRPLAGVGLPCCSRPEGIKCIGSAGREAPLWERASTWP